MKSALVTGATGFVGSRLTQRLVQDGWSVHVLVRKSSSLHRLAPIADQVATVVDPGEVTELAAGLEPLELDVCFHLAAHFVGQHTPDDIAPLIEGNVALPTRLAEALGTRPDLVFVNTGSAWQHVGGEPYNPAALYAATKQACKDILRFYADAGAFRVVNLALFDTYGPDDPRPKLLALLRKAQATGTTLGMSSGRQLIDLVYIDDVVDAFLAAADAPPGKEPVPEYAVATGSPLSVRELVDVVQRATGAPVPVEWGVRPDRAKEMLAPWDVAPVVPGWGPQVSLDEGIRRTWAS